MSDVFFGGGPLDGQVAPGAAQQPDPGMGPAAAGGAPAAESEGEIFKRILADARTLLGLGTLSEKSSLLIEKATTLIQQIKADEEKEEEQAMTGKLSPGVLRKLGGGGGI